MTRQDINQTFLQTAPPFSTAPTRPTSKRCRRASRRTPLGRAGLARVLRDARRRCGERRQDGDDGPSWERPNWPLTPSDDLTHALDGDWPATASSRSPTRSRRKAAEPAASRRAKSRSMRATRDSVRALMMIRAYRMRGHLHANLDPLGLGAAAATTRNCIPARTASTRPTTTARSSSTTCWGWSSRPSARCWRSCAAPIAARSASSSCTSPTPPRRRGFRSASRAGQGDSVHQGGQARHPVQAGRGEGFEQFFDVKYPGAKRFGLDGGEAMIPALEQIIKRGGAVGPEGGLPRHGASRAAQRAEPGDGQAAPRHLPRVQGRLGLAGRGRGLGRRQISSRRLVGPRVRRQQGASVAEPPTPRIWRSSIPSCSARCAPSRISSTTTSSASR